MEYKIFQDLKKKISKEGNTNINVIKFFFRLVHEDYCEYYENFEKQLETNIALIDEETLIKNDSNIIEWVREYKKTISYSKLVLEDFEQHIKNNKLFNTLSSS